MKGGVSMSLRYGILGFLSYDKMTGYDLAKAFQSTLANFWHATTSQIYRELSALEKEGLATSEIVYQADRPNKKEYAITPSGRETFRKWLSAGDAAQEPPVKNVFLMKLFFSDTCPTSDTIRMLEEYRNSCMAKLQNVGSWGKSIGADAGASRRNPIYWKLTRNYGSAQLAMCVTWAQNSIEELRKLDNGEPA